MKLLSRFLTAVLVIATVYACSSPTDSEGGFQGKQIGLWYMGTPATADWTGKQGKIFSGDDTMLVTEPDDHSLRLKYDSTSADDIHSVVGYLTDSTLTQHDVESHDLTVGFLGGDTLYNDNNLHIAVKGFMSTDTFVRSRFYVRIYCHEQKPDPDYLLTGIEDTVNGDWIWKIPVDGIKDTIEEIACP